MSIVPIVADPLRILVVFGTRPEIIKLAPVVKALEARPESFSVATLLTAQHREMADDMLALFDITPTHDLDLMRHGQQPNEVTAAVLRGVKPILEGEQPDLVIVQGDTVTVMATALAAFYEGIPVAHVEAGLRTHDKWNPFPEEMMRRLTAPLVDIHFAPTPGARDNLLAEGIADETIHVVGNTVIDALLEVAARDRPLSDGLLPDGWEDKRIILVTAHRRENWGEPLTQICEALKALAAKFEDAAVVYAMHRNPEVRDTALRILRDVPRVHLITTPDYADFVALMKRAEFILTDSGGIQEEAPSLGKPVLVLRDTTERPEGVAAGAAKLVGTDTSRIVAAAAEVLNSEGSRSALFDREDLYGDGSASRRIARAAKSYLGGSAKRSFQAGAVS